MTTTNSSIKYGPIHAANSAQLEITSSEIFTKSKSNFFPKLMILLSFTLVMILFVSTNIDAKARYNHEKSKNNGLQEITIYTGTVEGWANNEDFIYDGFYLQTKSDKILVKFKPHLGSQIIDNIKTGALVSVGGVNCKKCKRGKMIMLVSVTNDGKTIIDTDPDKLNIKTAMELVSGTGNINDIQKNSKHGITGFILDNKTILRIPKHVAKKLVKMTEKGNNISYSGMKSSLKNGEVAKETYSIINCKTITINSKQYLVK